MCAEKTVVVDGFTGEFVNDLYKIRSFIIDPHIILFHKYGFLFGFKSIEKYYGQLEFPRYSDVV